MELESAREYAERKLAERGEKYMEVAEADLWKLLADYHAEMAALMAQLDELNAVTL